MSALKGCCDPMNIIPKDQQADRCPVCHRNGSTVEACSHECQRVDLTHYIVTSYMMSDSLPHVHVKCDACGFQYLVEPWDPVELKRVL